MHSTWRLVRLHLPPLCSENQGQTAGCVTSPELLCDAVVIISFADGVPKRADLVLYCATCRGNFR
jgi:hypothetical protein